MKWHLADIVINKGYGGLNPTHFGYEYCKPSHDYGPVVRDHWLLHYVVSGEGIFQIDGQILAITAGDIFVIPPYVESYYRADEKNPWHYIWIGFTADDTLPVSLQRRIHCPAAGAVFDNMLKCVEMEAGKSAFLAARLWDLMGVLLEQERRGVDHIEKALHCMHSKYMDGIGIREISDRLNLERSYFSALFKSKTGVSPQAYLLELRMKKAAQLMTEQAMTPTMAAASVGYSDIYNFSRMFKRKFGVSPRGYVEKHKQIR